MANDEAVGYGRPPAATRWKPGQSGNPRGRPRNAGRDLLAEAARILSEPVSATTADGKTVRFGGLEAAYLALCRKALKGDKAALYLAMDAMLQLVPAGDRRQAEEDAEGAEAKRKLAEMLGLDVEDELEPG
jgi:Family of unknown function (DUF5681)